MTVTLRQITQRTPPGSPQPPPEENIAWLVLWTMSGGFCRDTVEDVWSVADCSLADVF